MNVEEKVVEVPSIPDTREEERREEEDEEDDEKEVEGEGEEEEVDVEEEEEEQGFIKKERKCFTAANSLCPRPDDSQATCCQMRCNAFKNGLFVNLSPSPMCGNSLLPSYPATRNTRTRCQKT